MSDFQNFESVNEGIRKTYNASGGCDIVATLDGILIGNLNGISFSTTREKAPIYVMGAADAVSFGRGKRGHAGSLIFTNFDRHALYDVMSGTILSGTDTTRYHYWAKQTDVPAGGRSKLLNQNNVSEGLNALGIYKKQANYSDQIPPFTISLTSMNEYGNISVMHILGVELINEGSGVSIDDIVTETQMTFVARAIHGWRPLVIAAKSPRGVNLGSIMNNLNEVTAVQQAADYSKILQKDKEIFKNPNIIIDA